MLTILTRSDRPLPTRAVKLMVENLTHENLLVRKCSIHVLGSILKQHKRSHPRVEIDTKEEQVKAPGDRQGNLFLCYDKDKVVILNQKLYFKMLITLKCLRSACVCPPKVPIT